MVDNVAADGVSHVHQLSLEYSSFAVVDALKYPPYLLKCYVSLIALSMRPVCLQYTKVTQSFSVVVCSC